MDRTGISASVSLRLEKHRSVRAAVTALNKHHCQPHREERSKCLMHQVMPRVVGRKSPRLCNAPAMHATLCSPYGSCISPLGSYRDQESSRAASWSWCFFTWETVPLSQLTDSKVQMTLSEGEPGWGNKFTLMKTVSNSATPHAKAVCYFMHLKCV